MGNAVENIVLKRGDALIIVDVQNDFLPGGALGVPDGDAVVPPANATLAVFAGSGLPIFCSRDWHPPDHCSFATRGGPWPQHCVQDTPGAEFSPHLQVPPDTVVISKGTHHDREEYSAMAGQGPNGETLDTLLKKRGVTRILLGGLATDYCVLNTVRDAAALGYEVYVFFDAIRAVDVTPGDGARAVSEMGELGVTMITTRMLTP